MSEFPLISVIVPVYKAESYLRRCTDSLLAQTYKNIEVLLIDDGSPDGSGQICDEIAKEDNRVRVIHQENRGVSMARQCGLDNAHGKYIIHADPDDWVDADMIECLYNKAKEENADMVICDFYTEWKYGTRYVSQKPSSLDHCTVQNELFQQLHGSCCNKLVARACYSAYGVKFPEGVTYCEDLYVNTCLLNHPLKVAYLPKAFYHYDQYSNSNSLVKAYTPATFDHDVRLLHLFDDALSGEGQEDVRRMALSSNSYSIVSRAFNSKYFSNEEYKHKFALYIKNILPLHFRRRGRSICIKIAAKGYLHQAQMLWTINNNLRKQIKKLLNTSTKSCPTHDSIGQEG